MKVKLVNTGDLPAIGVGALLALLVMTGRHLNQLTDQLLAEVGILTLGWLAFTYLFATAANTLGYYLFFKEETLAVAEPEVDALYMKYLWLRDHVLAAYQADPYVLADNDLETAYVPVDLMLPRHVYEKLSARAEDRRLSLSDVTTEMAVLGMADDHLTLLTTQPDWTDGVDLEGGSPWM
jgi:hypothetical protein